MFVQSINVFFQRNVYFKLVYGSIIDKKTCQNKTTKKL